MNKWLLSFFILLQFFGYITNRIDSLTFNSSYNMILFGDTCIYTTEKSNIINKIGVELNVPENIGSMPNITNKTLIKLSEEDFIIFGLNNSNRLSYYKSNINENSNDSKTPTELNFQIDFNCRNLTIKYIKEDIYLLYYICDQFYLYSFNLNNGNNKKGGNKQIDLDNSNNYLLNIVECDSFDDENIFCVYSIIENSNDLGSTSYSTFSYYSFKSITSENLDKNEFKKNIAGPSLLKIENNNKKQFLICYYENKEKYPSVYCQFFTQSGNDITIGKSMYIGMTIYSKLIYLDFKFQSLIQLIKYDNTIYIHLILKFSSTSKTSVLFVSSLDLNVNIPFYLTSNTEKKNILVSDKYILFLHTGNIEITNLEFNCPNINLFNLSDNQKSMPLNILSANNILNSNENNIYITFDLDPLTYIYVENEQNMGGLFYMHPIKEYNNLRTNISLVYNENLRITYNYYIYHSEDRSPVNEIFPAYKTFSNFCLLKVLNCFESCKTCNENIMGTEEMHQCTECKDTNYKKFIVNPNDTSFFNCYRTDDSIVQNNYYLDANGEYKKCDNSCFSCKNGKNCTQCNVGYYYKEDEYQYDNQNYPCYEITPEEYYLDTNTSSKFKVYRKCFETCSTCSGKGNITHNNCIACKSPFTKYQYDSTRCTKNLDECPYFWRINETNNIECINDCNGFIINEGDNKNQCVDNCQSYINPLNIWVNNLLISYSCGNEKYCITPDICQNKRWKYNYTTCYSNDIDQECFNVSDPNPPPTVINEEPSDEDPGELSGKPIIVKRFEFNETFLSQENFPLKQIKIYNNTFKKELNTSKYENGIDFITINRYKDFNLIIYPLQQEDYVHTKILKINNLSFINFSKYFKEINYTKQNNIIIGLVEFTNNNTPINSLNYFFFEYNEQFPYPIFIEKYNLTRDTSTKLYSEYFLKNFVNPNISERYSSNLISSIKELYLTDENLTSYNYLEGNDFYQGLCRKFTSKEGTDVTVGDRIEIYLTLNNLCENGCQIINLIDRGENENPRSICQCDFKKFLNINETNDTFINEKIEGKNVSNINVLKCAKSVFAQEAIKNNFVFWIFLFLILVILIILLIVIFCGKNSVENVLKIKKQLNESIDDKSKENVSNISDKISSDNSGEKFQTLEVKEMKNDSNYKNKEIISSKISYSEPPKRIRETSSTKTEKNPDQMNSINTTINFNNKIDLKFKNEDDLFEEIFPDYNEVLNNNYYDNKYMKNNYINHRLRNLKFKKYFLVPLTKDDYFNHNNTDTEDNLEDLNSFNNKRKKTTFNYFKTLLPKADLSEDVFKDYYESLRWETEYDLNTKKYGLKKSVKFFEDSNFLGDGNKNKKKKLYIMNLKESNDEQNKDNVYIHKKKKSLLSSNGSQEKKSNISSNRSLVGSKSMDKYFLNSSSNNNDIKAKYKLYTFYWIYLNKREFCLTSIYNMQDNVASYIRIATFIFIISLFFTLNCLFLTDYQIHERYIYAKEKGSINEFTYIFKKESGIIFLLAIIYVIVKMLIIKFIYGKLFRISNAAKEELSPFGGHDSENEDKRSQNIKRNKYIKKYRKKSIIYISIIFALMILLAYISICYFGIFINTKGGMILRFFISFIFSIIICAILCLIIIIIYHFARKYDKRWLKRIIRICNLIY